MNTGGVERRVLLTEHRNAGVPTGLTVIAVTDCDTWVAQNKDSITDRASEAANTAGKVARFVRDHLAVGHAHMLVERDPRYMQGPSRVAGSLLAGLRHVGEPLEGRQERGVLKQARSGR